MSNILIIGGNWQHIGTGSKYWGLGQRFADAGHDARLRECLQNSDENSVTWADVLWADRIIVYSYGCASLWKLWHDNADAIDGKRWQKLVIVVGVPDAWMSQFYGAIWHSPNFVESAVDFDVVAIPVSARLENASAIQVKLGDPIPDGIVNVDCNWLGLDHVSIKEDDRVLDAIFSAAGGQE